VNRRALLSCAVLVVAAAGMQGCELAVLGAAGGAAAYSIVEDRRSSGAQIDDETIQLRAQSRVSERFGDKAHVTVTSFNRMALLTGEAWDEAMRDEIGRTVQSVPNVRGITNEVQIGIPTPRASRINDEVITTKVKGRLIDSGKANPVHVKVVTEAGVVYLMGVVTDREAEDAVEIARTTGSVRKVVKIFDYCSPSDDPCRLRSKQAEPTPKPAP
jgi:osmotically-inducible protein OsmY